jgi:hypothetical protein
LILQKILKAPDIIINEYQINESENQTLLILNPKAEYSPDMPITLMNSIEGYVYIDRLPFIHTNLAKGLFILFESWAIYRQPVYRHYRLIDKFILSTILFSLNILL